MTASPFVAPWTVLTADCMAVLGDMPDKSVDVVIADPPYNAKTHKGAKSGFRPDQMGITFAPLENLDGLVREQIRISRRWVIDFCAMEALGAYELSAGDAWIRSGFWYRPDSTPQFSGDRPGQPGEGVAIMHRTGRKRWNGGGHAAYWSVCIERRDRVHATQKPIRLMMELVEQFTDPGDLVLDTHCGSGTTGVACLRLGRRFVGIEIDPAEAETARERLRAEERMVGVVATRAGQGALFG